MIQRRSTLTARRLPLAATLLASACSAGSVDVVGLDPDSLTLGMVAHWSCDEMGEGPLVDRSGNGHDGTLFGPASITGRFGGGLRFDPGNWVNVPSFPQATRRWSVALWYRAPEGERSDGYLTLAGNQQLPAGGWEMSTRLGGTGSQYRFSFSLGPDGGSASAQVASDEVEVDRWVHLAAVLDGDAQRLLLYRDGGLADDTAVEALIQPGSDNLQIGRGTDARRFLVGDLDDIVVFGRALVPAEVRALVAAPAPKLR
jgi:hypothetical protein